MLARSGQTNSDFCGDPIPFSAYCSVVASSTFNPKASDLYPVANSNYLLYHPSLPPGLGATGSSHRNLGAHVSRPKCLGQPQAGGQLWQQQISPLRY